MYIFMGLTLKQLSRANKNVTKIIPLKKKIIVSKVESLYYKIQNYAQKGRCYISASDFLRSLGILKHILWNTCKNIKRTNIPNSMNKHQKKGRDIGMWDRKRFMQGNAFLSPISMAPRHGENPHPSYLLVNSNFCFCNQGNQAVSSLILKLN